MSILIKGMEMPTRCIACQMNYDSCACILTGSRFYKYNTEFDPGEERLTDCPLAPVPEHGRLIDGDALKVSLAFAEKVAEWAVPALRAVLMIIDEMPTIIPADPAKEGEG